MKRSQPRRDWRAARAKVELEGACRNCSGVMHLEAAHVLAREHDRHFPIRDEGDWRPYQVHPDRIIPLCSRCHRLDHEGGLDKLRLLDAAEGAQAVMDAGSIESARVRLIPRSLREAA